MNFLLSPVKKMSTITITFGDVAEHGIRMKTTRELFEEQNALDWDEKKLMRGQVKNSLARHVLVYGEESVEPNYEGGQGRVIAFEKLPLTKYLREHLWEFLGVKGKNLFAEGNKYYDVRKCGIGFHGDAERRKVLACRLGQSLPFEYQWFLKSESVGKRGRFELDEGDFYIMSEKAVGTDWMKKNIYTLRHATGCPKYLKTKK